MDLENKFRYGQFFTKQSIVKKVLDLILRYKGYDKKIRILEPSFGTRNFITVLKREEFNNIEGCEIDPSFTKNPTDFFEYPISEKFDLIIGNPPFTKYNIKESYYYRKKYNNSIILKPEHYLTKKLLKKEKIKIENAFLLKSIKHLKNKESTIGFVLPISFFIKNRNMEIKKEIIKHFSTIIIYQNTEVWFDYNLPCCFAIFTNNENYENKIILIFDNKTGERFKDMIDMSKINEEIIPQIHFNKKNGILKNHKGTPLSKFLSPEKVHYEKKYIGNTVSGKNITSRKKIEHEDIENYKLAIVRVGNTSVGRCGLMNIKKDILNDMFYVFDFKEKYNNDKELKEKICKFINDHQEYFKNITIRIGSKSIKKEDVLSFRILLKN